MDEDIQFEARFVDLRRLCREAGVSQARFARVLGFSTLAVHKWMAGRFRPKPANMVIICEGLLDKSWPAKLSPEDRETIENLLADALENAKNYLHPLPVGQMPKEVREYLALRKRHGLPVG